MAKTDGMPVLNEEQRAAALQKAVETRVKRSEVRKRIKNRELTMADLIAQADDDPIIGGMKVHTALLSLPGYGKTKADRIMRQLNIAETRRMAGLGIKQRTELAERLG